MKWLNVRRISTIILAKAGMNTTDVLSTLQLLQDILFHSTRSSTTKVPHGKYRLPLFLYRIFSPYLLNLYLLSSQN